MHPFVATDPLSSISTKNRLRLSARLALMTLVLLALGITVSADPASKENAPSAPAASWTPIDAAAHVGVVAEVELGAQVQNSIGSLPVFFEENRGQQNAKVRYLTRGSGTTMFLTATEAVYVLRSPKSRVPNPKSEDENTPRQTSDEAPPSERAVALYMRLAGANPNAAFVGEEQLAHLTNYFKGSDPWHWQTGIPNYRRVSVGKIYAGVDMVWQGKEAGAIQYDFLVAPNADPKRIEWEIEGAENVSVEADGSLLIETEVGVMKQGQPFSYQATANNVREEVGSRWSVVKRNTVGTRSTFSVGFEIGNYDRTKTLVIDPTVTFSSLAYSTLLGGADNDEGNAIAIDNAGNAYVTGTTDSPAFPTVAGGFDPTPNGGTDVFVSKLNAAGSALIYSTFLGGSSSDAGNGIAVDSAGNAYLTGGTGGGGFPTTAGAFDTSYNGGGSDAFVSKLNATGSALIYSSFLGGNDIDIGNGIAVNSTSNAFVTGLTNDGTTDYPTTPLAFDTTHNGNNDAFVSKLNTTGSALAYSTFLGGSDDDAGRGIAANSAGNAFVTGFTNDATTDFPTTAGAFDTIHNGNDDSFVSKLDTAGSTLTYSTFLGGGGAEVANGIALDSAGNAYLTGRTSGSGFPTTAGAFDTSYNGGTNDAFLTKLNTAGSALAYSTFLGGSVFDEGRGIAVDSAGDAYLTGRTDNGATNFPTTAGVFDPTHNGSSDAFATRLNATGSALVSSTFLGGGSADEGKGIAADSAGNAYLTGRTSGAGFPTTTGAFDPSHNGGTNDVFVAKLSEAPAVVSAVSRKTHGLVGEFDIDLPVTGPPGLECRSAADYQVVVTFGGAVTLEGFTVSGGASAGAFSVSGSEVTLNVIPSDALGKRLIITMQNVTVGSATGDVAIPMNRLVGDTTGNGAVNTSDVGETKANSGDPVDAATFRTDVNVSGGTITSSDISQVKASSGQNLPP